MAACRLSSSPKKPVWGMPHTGLNNPPAQGNILKPDSPNDWRELGSQVTQKDYLFIKFFYALPLVINVGQVILL